MQRILCIAVLALAAVPGASAAERHPPAQDPPLKVGVFDTQATGGQGARVVGLLRGLNQRGYAASAITDLHPLTLLQHDVVYLSDMHRPGRVHQQWRQALADYVEAGGSVLQTWHHHLFGEVGKGVRRVRGRRRMHVVPGHPAVAGVGDFDAAFHDHIVERVGPRGTLLLKNDAGEAVAVAGTLGKGKVISTGLALAIPNGHASRPPRGAEAKLLDAFLAWLRPAIPRERRLAQALEAPLMHVSPPEAIVPAGFPARFQIDVACKAEATVRLDSSAGTVRPVPRDERGETPPDLAVQSYALTVPTEPRRNVRRQVAIRTTAGEDAVERQVAIESVYGKPPKDEVRGVWLHVGADRHPAKVMPELKRLGIGMVVLRIAGGTAAFYASKVQPDIQDPLAPDGDWLAEAVHHAHANGIEIHPYLNNCIVEGRTSPASLERLRAAGRLQQDPEGRTINWFCPSQEANVEAIERPMLEIVSRYEVDGIQYDFIRAPGPQGCFCPVCRERFERESGRPVADWPADVLRGPRHEEWVEFRCRRTSALVERISTRIREIAPRVKISAAVFRDWPQCRENNAQDWVRWCEEGWLDFVCPMNYTLDPRVFHERAVRHRAAVPEGFPILQGIGIASSRGRMASPEALAVQVALARRAGAAGFVCFCYQPEHTTELFAPLAEWLDE